jgi:hypothetical protein
MRVSSTSEITEESPYRETRRGVSIVKPIPITAMWNVWCGLGMVGPPSLHEFGTLRTSQSGHPGTGGSQRGAGNRPRTR